MQEEVHAAVNPSSASSAYRWLLELLDVVGSAPLGSLRSRQCPAHEDQGPSLSLGQGADGWAG